MHFVTGNQAEWAAVGVEGFEQFDGRLNSRPNHDHGAVVDGIPDRVHRIVGHRDAAVRPIVPCESGP